MGWRDYPATHPACRLVRSGYPGDSPSGEDMLLFLLVCVAPWFAVVGSHRDLPAGGQQALPTHGHLVTQRAGTRGDTTASPVLPSTGTCGTGRRSFGATGARSSRPPSRPITVPRVPATAARESNP